MKHLQLYEEFNSENEGLKSWGAGLMAGLSLFANAAMGGDLKVKGTGMSSRLDIAIKKAESNARLQAMKQIGGDGSLSGTIANTRFDQPKITKDKEGNYVATVEMSVDSSDVNVKKVAPGQIMPGEQAKSFIDDIIKMGYNGSEDINEFIDKYSDSYDFKISKMTPEQADEVGEMSIKLSKTFSNGNIAYCVVTPIGK
jgi:hypothetical protein